jgi:hypothetical protein
VASSTSFRDEHLAAAREARHTRCEVDRRAEPVALPLECRAVVQARANGGKVVARHHVVTVGEQQV